MAEKAWERQQKDDWLRLLRTGDHQAFAELIDKYKGTVFLCCRKLGLTEDEVEDVVSETFLAAYKGLGRYTGRAELSTWLWSIAYRQAVSHLRKNRRHRLLAPALVFDKKTRGREAEVGGQIADGSQQPAGELTPEPTAVLQCRETERIVWAAVDRLPRLWAVAVILFYREQKTVAEMAKIMRTKENTVKTYLFRARERLKTALAPAFGDHFDADGQIERT